MASSIIISTSKIRVCGIFYDLCDNCGYDREWSDRLWGDIITDESIYEELAYYVLHHTFKDSFDVCGYSLSDLYVFQMDKYNLIREIGKNPPECNKQRMVLNAFRMMVDMKADPDTYVKRIQEGRGEDRL
ncbi:MAG: hypothetical protein K6F28_04030 [Lachnospiraceae bacterium]|nr:hypothetical protein [Lachnospiraceae bacterium]